MKVDQTFSEFIPISSICDIFISECLLEFVLSLEVVDYTFSYFQINLDYISDLMDAVVSLRNTNDSYLKAKEAINHQRRLPPPLSQSTPKPPKNVTIQRHVTRFNVN